MSLTEKSGAPCGEIQEKTRKHGRKAVFLLQIWKGTCGKFTAVRIIERRAILRQWRENDGNIMNITTGAAEKQPLPFVDL